MLLVRGHVICYSRRDCKKKPFSKQSQNSIQNSLLVICRQIEEEYSRKKSELELESKRLEEEHRKSLESCQRYSANFSESVFPTYFATRN